ncbi:hypothetical protein M427DRAFT_413401 [Gonapodya prolifera JEL478]|uniref:Uncharacterized protein n=1 Tax=Gonapodya prolifera (strain JEL478) TaxID=1344416 RepID=A0A139A6J6_GONPJ|nr:hypothetical protein M427DRAFT_413401 [Gonapodya prolifera JEL478]|eukprot:KXS12065.1 hypothetical protein M427DRAFT_413401 [Gonapodya prolifera JEL478]
MAAQASDADDASDTDVPFISLVSPFSKIPPGSAWQTITAKVGPIWNGESLRGTAIEDLNVLVIEWLQSGSLSTLKAQLIEFINGSMGVLAARLGNTPNESVVTRTVELWIFFFSILPTMEGCFLPLRSCKEDPDLDVRRLCMRAFRDVVILPNLERLSNSLDKWWETRSGGDDGRRIDDIAARILQMLLLLHELHDEKEKDIGRVLQKLKESLATYKEDNTSSTINFRAV